MLKLRITIDRAILVDFGGGGRVEKLNVFAQLARPFGGWPSFKPFTKSDL